MPRPKYIRSLGTIRDAMMHAGKPFTMNDARKAQKRLDQMAGIR